MVFPLETFLTDLQCPGRASLGHQGSDCEMTNLAKLLVGYSENNSTGQSTVPQRDQRKFL